MEVAQPTLASMVEVEMLGEHYVTLLLSGTMSSDSQKYNGHEVRQDLIPQIVLAALSSD
jgi:hypothetical protein